MTQVLWLWLLLIFSRSAQNDASEVYYKDQSRSPGFRQLEINIDNRSAQSILQGHVHQLGNFEDCVSKRKQQYCLSNIVLYAGDRPSQFWFQIQNMTAVRTNFRRDLLYVGVCVPKSSTIEHIEMDMVNTLKPAATALGVHITVSIDPRDCQIWHKTRITNADIIFGVVLLFIISLVITGTLYDNRLITKEQNEADKTAMEKVLLCFSVRRNWNRMLTSNNTRTLHYIEGIRTLLAFKIIMLHVVFFNVLIAIANLEWFESFYSTRLANVLYNPSFLMTIFFCIGGFLLGYNITRRMESGTFTFMCCIQTVIQRYVTYTPTVIFLMAFSATWLKHFGSGPFWPLITGTVVENCRHFWWTNLFYLNNYIYAGKQCLPHTWYLAADFQNYLTSLFTLMMMYKYPKWKWHITGFVFSIWIIVPFIQTYCEQLDPVPLFTPEIVRHLAENTTVIRAYITFHHYAAPYFLSVILGHLLFKVHIKYSKLSKVTILMLWTVGITLLVCLPLTFYELYRSGYEYNLITASLYSALYKPMYATGVGSILLLYSLGYGGILGSALSWKVFQKIGPLTYGIYLTHFILEIASSGNSKERITTTLYSIILRGMFNFIAALALSLMLHLCIQMPVKNLYELKLLSGSEISKRTRNSVYIATKYRKRNITDKYK